MDEEDAVQLADDWIKAILENQPQAFGNNPPFHSPNLAETAAAGLATFRKKLIEELKKQG